MRNKIKVAIIITITTLLPTLSFDLCFSSSTKKIIDCGDNTKLANWFIRAYDEGMGVSDSKIDYEAYEVELLFYLFPDLSYEEKVNIDKIRRKNNLPSLFFSMAREYSIFWERGVIIYCGSIKPAIYGKGINDYDIVLIFGDYPKLSTLVLSVGFNNINKIIINGNDPIDILKRTINENGDKIFWRDMIQRERKGK